MNKKTSFSLPPDVAAWLDKTVKNKSAFVTWLIRQHAGLQPNFEKETGEKNE